MSTTYNVVEARTAQAEYCEKTDTPHFAPRSGECWRCNRNIYEKRYWKYENGRGIEVSKDDAARITGITIEEAGMTLVTGCPHCNRSYVD